MLIKLVGHGTELDSLTSLVNESLRELGLSDLVTVEMTTDEAYKMELGITQNPALCIEESSIDFKDMIFEGIVPEKAELNSMFVSILGTEESGSSCGTGGCGSCSTGCGSHDAGDSCETHTHDAK